MTDDAPEPESTNGAERDGRAPAFDSQAGVRSYGPGAVCESCGYGLEGLSEDGRCPECGHSSNTAPLWPVWDDRPLPDWCECPHCGYSVAGLSGEARCSECGAPAVWGLQAWRLRFWPVDVLRSMSRGAAMAFWGMILLIAGPICSIALVIIAQAVTNGSEALTVIGSVLFGISYIAAAALTLGGFWRLTARAPAAPLPKSAQWTRLGIILLLGSTPLVVGGFMYVQSGAGIGWAFGGLAVFSVGYLVLQLASLFLARRLSLGMNETGLQTYALTCLIACPILSIVGGCVFSGLGSLAATVMFVILLAWLGRAIRREAARAQRLTQMAGVRLGGAGTD